MKSITCIIVEDNLEDSNYLQELIQSNSLFDLRAVFENALSASSFIHEFSPQLIFMDIDMPGLNGMEFFKKLDTCSQCIFVTAHSEYAAESYEALAFDYLLKPVKRQRFNECVNRFNEYLELKRRSDIYETEINQHTITIPEGTARHIVNINSILYIEALRDYCKVYTNDRKIVTSSNLKHFITLLPENEFIRIHRSYVVAVDKVAKVEIPWLFLKNSIRLAIGRTFKNNINSIFYAS